MDDQSKNLKETLDNTTFKNFDFNEENRRKVHKQYMKHNKYIRSTNLFRMIKYSSSLAACLSLTIVIVYFFIFSDGVTNTEISYVGEEAVFTINVDDPELTMEKLINYRKAVKQDVIETANVDFTNYRFATTDYVYKEKHNLVGLTRSLGGLTKAFFYLNEPQTSAIVLKKGLSGVNHIYYFKYDSTKQKWYKTDYTKVEGLQLETP